MRKHTAVMIAAICLVMTLPAAALGAKPALTDAQYYQKILDRIEQIRSAGGSETAIDRMLEKEFGWTKLATADGIEAMAAASASDVNIYAPTVFYNNVKARYEAVGSWSWRKCPTAPCWSINYGTSGGNVGGPDAFGIYSSIPVNYKTTAFAIYDEDGDGHSYTNPDDFDTTGVAFREQDTVHVFPWGDFTWDHGTLLMAFAQVLLWPPGHAIHLEIHDGPHLARRGCALNLCEPIFRTAEHHLQHLWRVGELLEGCQPKSDLLVRLRNLKGPHHAKPGRGPSPDTTEWGPRPSLVSLPLSDWPRGQA